MPCKEGRDFSCVRLENAPDLTVAIEFEDNLLLRAGVEEFFIYSRGNCRCSSDVSPENAPDGIVVSPLSWM